MKYYVFEAIETPTIRALFLEEAREGVRQYYERMNRESDKRILKEAREYVSIINFSPAQMADSLNWLSSELTIEQVSSSLAASLEVSSQSPPPARTARIPFYAQRQRGRARKRQDLNNNSFRR